MPNPEVMSDLDDLGDPMPDIEFVLYLKFCVFDWAAT